ncbi:nucleotidyltransferase family protein [Chryseomicrobium palamuruense]
MLKTKEDILNAIQQDPEMMTILRTVKRLDLPDSWVCAGFVRLKIWDVQHGFSSRSVPSDVDVIYFDLEDVRESTEKIFEAQLRKWVPGVPWSVKNQARMHEVNGLEPFISSVDGMAHFPETVTALGVRLTDDEQLELAAPWGIADVLALVVRPTDYYTVSHELRTVYTDRIAKKNWPSRWPKVKVLSINEVIG